MKDEITITKKELTRKLLIASSRSAVKLSDKTKNPQIPAMLNLVNTIFIGEILKILFEEDDLLIVPNDV